MGGYSTTKDAAQAISLVTKQKITETKRSSINSGKNFISFLYTVTEVICASGKYSVSLRPYFLRIF